MKTYVIFELGNNISNDKQIYEIYVTNVYTELLYPLYNLIHNIFIYIVIYIVYTIYYVYIIEYIQYILYIRVSFSRVISMVFFFTNKPLTRDFVT